MKKKSTRNQYLVDRKKRLKKNLKTERLEKTNPACPSCGLETRKISEAYAVLSNEEKRNQYDRFGFSKNLFDGADFSDAFSEFGFGDIFETFFGSSFGGGSGSSRRKARSRGSDMGIEVEVSFKESAFGIKKEIEYEVEDICEECRGSGARKDSGIETCPQCGGMGKVRVNRQTFIGNVVTTSDCDKCNGTGKIIKNPCGRCRGQGHHSIKKKIKVDIPAGIHHGDKLRVTGRGNSLGKDSISGDLFITMKVIDHPGFERVEDNVLSEIKISFAQAALGLRLETDTLDGPEKIKIKPGTQPETKIILRSRGFVQLNGYRRGDHIINIKVEIPKRLSRQEKEMFTNYARARKEPVG